MPNVALFGLDTKTSFQLAKLQRAIVKMNKGALTKAGKAIRAHARDSIKFGGEARFNIPKTTKEVREEQRRLWRELYHWRKNGKRGPRPKLLTRDLLRALEKTSRPGKPPFDHTGYLKKSIAYNVTADGTDVIVGPQLHTNRRGKDVLKALEHGGTSKNAWHISKYIKPRPFMKPALDGQRQRLAKYWKDAFAKL